MPTLAKLKNKHRLRYKIYFPAGTIKERSRLYNTLSEARAKEMIANTIEAMTAHLKYTQDDLIIWKNSGLISSTSSRKSTR